eukprot:CAMPEP_0185568994 /NCGR_PEP_ID=MMETSP0434-20130131/1767_1 /TAXON_ID=626734 ORGANISM="Favella taraikaensis, Strain Fe Narragansett Bay" /NCGR_SAMPLE_ID=MMETSP0434 /ASSEMBLY_ACC=CAM_ASM_000379 /LENGTH=122 /DNA_ID=CAMNT_0028183651 /DNA_START=2873 /DNA_END=3241 /DNA_ORIENTATION=+
MVGFVGLHGQHDAHDHVAGAASSLVLKLPEQLARRRQIEEGLITELHLTAHLPNVENFGHLVEPEEQLVGLLVARLVVSEQIDLELDAIELLGFAAAALLLLALALLPLDVFDVEADARAQL